MKEIIGIVKKHNVALPAEVDLPDGTQVRVTWDDAKADAPPPYDRQPLSSDHVRADLERATGNRFRK
ncbi:MAG: hypothetical protein O2923_14370 [Verrucomicrobia bacterium]|nr:hypothetical protein [Verrucomicrobiota bacterium]MDA1087796.1 hypothetical protein [Verrucomicrobiota bacterium]